MTYANVLTGHGPPEVLQWAEAEPAVAEPGPGQIRIRVRAAGISPTDLAIRSGVLKAFPLPPRAVLGFEAAGVVDALGPGVTGVRPGDEVAAFLPGLGGYGELALATVWTAKPAEVSWADAAGLPSSAEAAVGVLRQLGVRDGETMLLLGGGGAVGVLATQLAVASGVRVLSAVGAHDRSLAESLGAEPVDYREWADLTGPIDAVFDAAGKGGLADAVRLAGGPDRVITLSGHEAAQVGVRLSEPTPDRAPDALDVTMPLLAAGKLRLRAHRLVPFDRADEAHRLLETGQLHERVILSTEE
ncbi:MAG: NADP-dependent oxidoreductase [Actinoplanes sp.]